MDFAYSNVVEKTLQVSPTPVTFVNVTYGIKEANGMVCKLKKGREISEVNRYDNGRRDDATKSQRFRSKSDTFAESMTLNAFYIQKELC